MRRLRTQFFAGERSFFYNGVAAGVSSQHVAWRNPVDPAETPAIAGYVGVDVNLFENGAFLMRYVTLSWSFSALVFLVQNNILAELFVVASSMVSQFLEFNWDKSAFY